MKKLKTEVFNANKDLVKYGLVIFTWGNVSGIDRARGLVVIKPSGMSYEKMEVEDMVVIDLDGRILQGKLKPSSDTPTHLVLYRNFPGIGGIVHTHSPWATSWAQARRPVPAYGTTHADYFHGEIPCTRQMTDEEIRADYEAATGHVIVETFRNRDPLSMPAVLVSQHGPFTWGTSPGNAVHNAVVLEEVAKMAFHNEVLGNRSAIGQALLDKHYLRKHGKDAYYGQEG